MSLVNTLFLDQVLSDEQAARVSVAQYSAAEVIGQFLALYNCLDFKAELEDIGIGRFQFMRRKKALRELRALCIALWGIALQKSFPDDAGSFFAKFRETAPVLAGPGREAVEMQTRVNVYIDRLLPERTRIFCRWPNILPKFWP